MQQGQGQQKTFGPVKSMTTMGRKSEKFFCVSFSFRSTREKMQKRFISVLLLLLLWKIWVCCFLFRCRMKIAHLESSILVFYVIQLERDIRRRWCCLSSLQLCGELIQLIFTLLSLIHSSLLENISLYNIAEVFFVHNFNLILWRWKLLKKRRWKQRKFR